MSTKRERSNHESTESRRQKQNTGGRGPTRPRSNAKQARDRDSTSEIPRKHDNRRSH